ncbi:hypothetical protein EYZ11_001806 [Aspergillus tanneri]|uniref:Uncharacterized protein n=1 Tax=Aspergillus tanneri TaxID=1220188 RepID=A0A4S3JSE1_9EURO|nr:hypothetical protein EYZ11_001806 [Aspergillus tanneri]
MENTFNPTTPDADDVNADISPTGSDAAKIPVCLPPMPSYPEQVEGHNDALVSVASSRRGGEAGYKRTIFNSIPLYLNIAEVNGVIDSCQSVAVSPIPVYPEWLSGS